MKKVIVIGCPGGGKSTFARKLRDETGLPLYYLDMIWHKPDKTNITRAAFDRELDEILNADRWIIDGNYSRTLEKRLQKCDTVFFLDLPTQVCLDGVSARIGVGREDMPWVEETWDEEFRVFIQQFQENERPGIYTLLEKYPGKKVVIFTSRAQMDNYIGKL